MCEVPLNKRTSSTLAVLLMPSHPIRFLAAADAAKLLRSDGGAAGNSRSSLRVIDRAKCVRVRLSFSSNRFCSHMDSLSGYAHRPFPFVLRYLRQRLASHVVILTAVVAAVACSVGTQYGVKYLVDGLSAGPAHARRRMAGIRFSHVADRRRQFPVADRQLDRELHLRRSDRRSAPRHLPPSDRPCAELFLRPAAGHADQPHHRHVECGLHRREHVRLERAAAVHRDGRGDRADRNRQPADGGRPDRRRRRHGGGDVPPGRRGQAAA